MAKQELYTIQDKTAKMYNRPMTIVNKGKAIQVFAQMVNDKEQGDIAKWPDQFNLVKLGIYDDGTGKIETLDSPEIIANGLDVVENENKKYTLEELAKFITEYQEKNIVKLGVK